jgi:hypothetical protein
LAVHVQATDQLRAVIASAMTSPQLELGEIADTRSAPRSSAGTAKALDDLEIFIGEVDGSEAAEGGTIDGTEAIEALNALRAAFAGRQPSVGNDDVDQASARALVLENSKLREDVEKWHRVAMEAGAITCVGGTHIYPLRDEVKKLRAEVARLTDQPQTPSNPPARTPGVLESDPALFNILNSALGTMHYHRLMSALNWNGYVITREPRGALNPSAPGASTLAQRPLE